MTTQEKVEIRKGSAAKIIAIGALLQEAGQQVIDAYEHNDYWRGRIEELEYEVSIYKSDLACRNAENERLKAETLADLQSQLRHAISEAEFYKAEFERVTQSLKAPEVEIERLLAENAALCAQVAELEGLLPEVYATPPNGKWASDLDFEGIYAYQRRKKKEASNALSTPAEG
jgi:chromosome segregation ATPase